MMHRYEDGTIELTIPVALKNNNEGQTRHFSNSVKEKKEFTRVLHLLKMQSDPPNCQQRIIITRILGKGERLWDADSVLRGNAKQLLDSLVNAGFFIDDGPKYIYEAIGRQDTTRRGDGPAIHVRMEQL